MLPKMGTWLKQALNRFPWIMTFCPSMEKNITPVGSTKFAFIGEVVMDDETN